MNLEEKRQPFEKHKDLTISIEHAANYWKTDSTWSNHLYQINLLCEDHVSKKDLIEFIRANPKSTNQQITDYLNSL